MSKIYVIHENDAWVEPLRAAFAEQGLPYEEWFLAEGVLDLESAPPEGVFYNRMSASSHTRDHRYAGELTGGVLRWLEHHGRRVVNDSRALQLEINKRLYMDERSRTRHAGFDALQKNLQGLIGALIEYADSMRPSRTTRG